MKLALVLLQVEVESRQYVVNNCHECGHAIQRALEKHIVNIDPYPDAGPSACYARVLLDVGDHHAQNHTENWVAVKAPLEQAALDYDHVPSWALRIREPQAQLQRLPLNCKDWG